MSIEPRRLHFLFIRGHFRRECVRFPAAAAIL